MVFYYKARPDAGDYTIYMGADKNENEELIKYGLPEDVWFHVDKVSSAHVYLRLKKGESIDSICDGLLEDCAQLVKAHSIQGNKMNNVEVVYTPWSNLKKSPSMDVGQVGFHNTRMVRVVIVEKRVNEIINRLNKTRVERRPDLKAEKTRRTAESARGDQLRRRAAGGDGEAGEGEAGGDTELQGPHGRREDDLQPPDRLRRQLHAGDGGRLRLIHPSIRPKPATAPGHACVRNKAERKMQLKEKRRREEMERLEKERRAEIRSYKGLMVAEKMTSNRQIASAGNSMQEMEDDFV
ncbi:hypothetical protein OsI_03744 [Oryza sativa Indica Group]|uniref:NFACT RNA-binding domain-containing protein n=1 Tax=Oryza sativa subsp. indica TaxID=39946 RepID=B8A9F9_ORYSI|nr:hypothetical protein OsI_03744 [Oryza sativa Indica Group]